MASSKIAPLGDAGRRLRTDIKDCLFTPFLGAGASSLRPEKIDVRQEPWKNVAETLAAIRCELQTDTSIEFLRSFSRQRLRMSKNALTGYIPKRGEPECSATLKGSKLVELQVAIVRSTVRLTRYFGRHFAKEAPSVHQLEECRVSFSTKNLTGLEAIRALLSTADIASALQKYGGYESPFLYDFSQIDRGLRIQGLYEKILSLIVVLLPEEEAEELEELKKHRGALDPLPDEMKSPEPKSRGHLRLESIQWLSDLLWYTLRYWLPRYPTTAELAFELSLEVRDAPPRRAELAQTAQALENEGTDLPQTLNDLLDYCERGSQREGDGNRDTFLFYYAIAVVMQYQYERYAAYQFERYKERRGTLEPADFWPSASEKEGSNEDNGGDAEVLQPLILTTNFDNALERVFTSLQISHHILFPVRALKVMPEEKGTVRANLGGRERFSIEWNLRTYYDQEAVLKGGKLFDDKPWYEIWSAGKKPKFRFIGPLIVKLHGAPRESLETLKVKHWVVLSEVSYLQALQDSGGLAWITEQLESPADRHKDGNRSMWFLGYSIADWNVRLRLYRDCGYGEGGRSTIDRDSDVFRCAILGNLNVDRYIGDLNRVPPMIRRIMGDHSLKKSDGLKKTLGTLEAFLDSMEG
jgi:hypothetical protein